MLTAFHLKSQAEAPLLRGYHYWLTQLLAPSVVRPAYAASQLRSDLLPTSSGFARTLWQIRIGILTVRPYQLSASLGCNNIPPRERLRSRLHC